MNMITKTSSKEQEYKKLFELQNLKNSTLNALLTFQKENPSALRLDDFHAKNPEIIKQGQEAQKLSIIFEAASKEYIKYRESLERKYKFQFPVECYADTTFAEYFKNLMR